MMLLPKMIIKPVKSYKMAIYISVSQNLFVYCHLDPTKVKISYFA